MNALTESDVGGLHPSVQPLLNRVSPAAMFAGDRLVTLGKASASDIGNALALPLDTAERALSDLVRVGVARRQAPRTNGGWTYVWVGD